MKVDFLSMTRLSHPSFTISLSRKTQITPRYSKPQKNQNIKIKLCLHYNIKLNIHFWLNTYKVLLWSTIVKIQRSELKLAKNQTYFRKLKPIFSQLIFLWKSSIYKIKNIFVVRYHPKTNCRLFRHMTSSTCHQENLNFNTPPKGVWFLLNL